MSVGLKVVVTLYLNSDDLGVKEENQLYQSWRKGVNIARSDNEIVNKYVLSSNLSYIVAKEDKAGQDKTE